MSTAIATGIEKTKIMEVLRGAGTCGVAFSTDEEFIYISLERNGLRHWLVVGEYQGRDVNGVVKSSQLRLALKRGKRDSMVEFEYADDGIAVRIDGEVRWTLTDTSQVLSGGPFKFIGDHVTTVPHEAAKAGSLIDWACDTESSRYSTRCVRFEKGFAVATDGRRMNTMDLGLDWDVLATVPANMVEFADKFGYEVSRYKFNSDEESQTEYLIAGELICEFSGRYPDWGRGLPDNTDELVTLDAGALLQNCQDHLDTRSYEERGITLVVGELTFLVDANFLAEMIRKMKLKTLAIQTTFSEPGDDRSMRPLLITSDDASDWQQVLMPMNRN